MPVSICPRCKHFNPEYAVYCYFDGVVLQAQQSAAALRLPNEFSFPSGRRCKTFDELAQGCQEEWASARDLLMRGKFAEYFQKCNRADLVRAANDAKAQHNADIGLSTFLSSLPGTRTQTPKLDLNPRRILLGKLTVGDSKTVPLTVTNQGQGILQGTLTVAEGQDWLSLSDKSPLHELEVQTAREQAVKLTINTKGLAAGQSYVAKLTVVTNGGVVEVSVRMDLVSQPFTRAPFQGVRSQREFAERMRAKPKEAVPILESGDVQRWFALNGWTYPIHGEPIKGVGGVQQFFEGIGVSKPPQVSLSQAELRLSCKYKETIKSQVILMTPVKKWVFAQLKSDSPWLKTPMKQVAGPQKTPIPIEIDTNLWNAGPVGEGVVMLIANGGQKLRLKVIVEVQGAPAIQKPKAPAPTPSPGAIAEGSPPAMPVGAHTGHGDAVPSVALGAGGVKFIPALATTVLLCLVLRMLLIPFVDGSARSSVSSAAATKLNLEPAPNSEFAAIGGWLKLPWLKILAGANDHFSADVFQPGNQASVSTLEFRHYFVTYLIRWFVIYTGWLGAIAGVVLVLKRGGGVMDIPWGVVAGLFAGFAGSATFGAFFLFGEMVPHTLWAVIGDRGGIGFWLMWVLLALFSWLLIGVALGIVLPWIGPLRRLLIDPAQNLIASLIRLVGMKSLGDYWSPA